jgi:hypothetical protein
MPEFEDVAGHFADELRSYGLEPVPLGSEETDTDGVGAKIANWPGNRPFISIWFDQFLDGVPHFWFGFESDHERIIKQLVDEAARFDEFKRPVKVTYNDLNDKPPWRLLKAKVRELKKNGGLSHEQYRGEAYAFGKYDLEFNSTSAESLAKDAARFVGGVIERTHPVKAALPS